MILKNFFKESEKNHDTSEICIGLSMEKAAYDLDPVNFTASIVNDTIFFPLNDQLPMGTLLHSDSPSDIVVFCYLDGVYFEGC